VRFTSLEKDLLITVVTGLLALVGALWGGYLSGVRRVERERERDRSHRAAERRATFDYETYTALDDAVQQLSDAAYEVYAPFGPPGHPGPAGLAKVRGRPLRPLQGVVSLSVQPAVDLVAKCTGRVRDAAARQQACAFGEAVLDLATEQSADKLWERLQDVAAQSRAVHDRLGVLIRQLFDE